MRMWKNGNPYTLLVGMYCGASTLENSLAVTQNVKYRATTCMNVCVLSRFRQV